MSKDPFQILADDVEKTGEKVENLQRTSLNRDEAEDLNQVITKGQADMLDVSKAVEVKIQHHIATAIMGIETKTIDAARNGAVAAIEETRQESLKVAQEMSQAAGEARKQAWRYFGGFWVWLVAMGALGAFVGAVTTMAVQGRADGGEFGKYTSVYCETAGGTKVSNTDGQNFCAVPM